MGSFILKGILIGLIFGVPAGAVGAMTVQRTLNYGMKAGLLTGLGSSVADCLYACIGVFGLTLISDFLFQHQNIINFVGGCLILGMGIRMLQAKASELENIPDSVRGIKLFISSFAIGVTNPTAILTFLFAFSWFSIDGQSGLAEGIGLVAGVFLGTFCWWSVISGTVIMLEKKAKNNRLPIMKTVFGIILVLFGAVVLYRNVLN
ncbi:LysE family translocator [Robinsoniella peoriensis]|uniref:LysE family translocator n=1 Tax=Robinsoniella peoriensis TaxID=180332 RepID=UPI003750EAAC